jgi:DNA uptake protein ComE-like DNA-binding protein
MLIALARIKTPDGDIAPFETVSGLSSADEMALLKLGYIREGNPGETPEGIVFPPEAEELDFVIDLNTATVDQLMSLKHIGKKTAQKIVDARPLVEIADLKVIAEMPEEKFAEIEKHIGV